MPWLEESGRAAHGGEPGELGPREPWAGHVPLVSREIRLASRPRGWPQASDFALAETSVPSLSDGEVLVQNLYISVDPYLRERMNEVQSEEPPLPLGRPLEGAGVGRVMGSKNRRFAVGDCVGGNLGWREYAVSSGKALLKLDPHRAPLSAYLGALGPPGLSAYVGLLDIGQPKAGETVFVSAAAGAVGGLAGQIARIKGCRVVGSVGSDAKVEFVRRELGFEAAFNYKNVDPATALADACPHGIDVYFDNVGGNHLQAALTCMRPFGRVVLCGMISQYNAEQPPPGPNNLMMLISKRISMRGFLVSDHFSRMPRVFADMSQWLKEGLIRSCQTVVDGIENAPGAFLGLLRGENVGKMLVRLDPRAGRGEP